MDETKTIIMLLMVGAMIYFCYLIYKSVQDNKKEEIEKKEHLKKIQEEQNRVRHENSIKWNNNIQSKFKDKINYKTNKPVKALVGDYTDMAIITNTILRSMGIETEIVPTASDIIDRVLNGNEYDIIITNNIYPQGERGQDIINRLKEDENFDIPIIILTVDQNARNEYLSDGFDEYISKPIDIDKVKTVFPELIDGLKFTKIKSNKSVN